MGDSGFWQSVILKKILMYCASCKHLGHSIETCYMVNPGLRPQRPNGNWQTRIDNKKLEVLPLDTPQPLDTPRPEPSITNQIADARSVIVPTESRANATDSTSIQELIGQDVTTHNFRIRELSEYNTHLLRASNTDFRL